MKRVKINEKKFEELILFIHVPLDRGVNQTPKIVLFYHNLFITFTKSKLI